MGQVVGGCKACKDQVSHLHPFSTRYRLIDKGMTSGTKTCQERIVSLGPILLRKPSGTQDFPAVSDLQISKSKSLEIGDPNGAGKGTNDLEDPDGSGAKHDKALLDSTLSMKSEKDQVDMVPASHPHGISPEKEPEEIEMQPALTTKVTM